MCLIPLKINWIEKALSLRDVGFDIFRCLVRLHEQA